MTTLEFSGVWPLHWTIAVALGLAILGFFLYRRETSSRRDVLRWILPSLRALAILLIVLMFSGPFLRHRKIVGQLGRVVFCVDASRSMALPDPNLEPHRKFLALRSRGQIAQNAAPDFELSAAADNLASAAAIAEKAKPDQGNRGLQDVCDQVVASVERAAVMLKSTARDELLEIRRNQKQRIDELLQRVRVISNAHPASEKWSRDLNAIAQELSREELILRENYANASALAIENLDSKSRTAYERFSEKSRWQRSESLLLHPLTGLLREVAAQHRIELRSLDGPGSSWIWRSENPARQPLALPDAFDSAPTNETTDLATILKTVANAKHEDERVAVVILSDGQHNSAASAIEAAQTLGRTGIPIYCIGFGSTIAPADEALIGVRAPESLSLQERMRGELLIKDELPVGQGFTIRIQTGGTNLWSKNLISEGRSRRNIPYDFSLKQSMTGLDFDESGLKVRHKTLHLKAVIDPAKNEACQTNNDFRFAVQVVREKPEIILLDDSEGWEFRVLRDELERSGHWRVNGVPKVNTSGNPQDRSFFPAKEQLSSCAALIMGCPKIEELGAEEQQSIVDFVEKDGGTLLLIDDPKYRFSPQKNNAILALSPVQWEDPPFISGTFQLRMPQIEHWPLGFSLDARTNAQVWDRLPGPHSTADVSPKGGSETLLELIGGRKPLPALVSREAGAGRVLYFSFNETWRWFYGEGSYYYAQFWNQLLKSSTAAAFATENESMALDAGDSIYKPGSRVLVRAKWIDPVGRPVDRAKVEAHLFRDHLPLGVIHLNRDQHRIGTLSAQTSELPEGEYEVRLKVDDAPFSKPDLAASFLVQKAETTELTTLTCNEPLLKEMATLSGGAYLREEEAGRLARMLQTTSQGRVVESQTLLWQSWWWFGTIVLLFGVEWSLRKRGGLL